MNYSVSSSSDTGLLGNPTDFELFAEKNIMHEHYHDIKAHLVVRDFEREYLSKLVDLSSQQFGKYTIIQTGEVLYAKAMKKELQIFEEAAILKVAEMLWERYRMEPSGISKDNILDFPESFRDEYFQMGELLHKKIEAKDFSISEYESKICGEDFERLVIRFVAKAYELVYNTI